MSRMISRSKTIRAKNDGLIERGIPRAEDENPAYGSFEHILRVLDGLDSVYGNESAAPDSYATGEPLDGLILTLLSQNTNDKNRDAAYGSLRSIFPKWGDVARARTSEIARAIKSAGLGDIKAGRMKAILEKIAFDFKDYTLAAMKGWEAEKVREYLSSLHGIGPKTVACVMVFDLGLPAFPVDTHVARLSRRLGWADKKTPPEKIQDFLESIVPPERCGGGHLNMIEHGRAVCHARGGECGACAVNGICRRNIEKEPAE
ncbi:MAG: endonuclease III [Synergistaceae bacterium]|jgi:endonuclease-3|nr:endonuclease III [Synergistaceae bacterium]